MEFSAVIPPMNSVNCLRGRLWSRLHLRVQETCVHLLGQEDPFEKATHSSILAWEIPRTEEPYGLQSMKPQKSQT